MLTVNKIIYSFLAAIFCGLSLVSYIVFNEFYHQRLVINFLDIGQGDAILITTPQGRDIIIDGGPDNTLIYKLGKYLPFYDRQIDLMVLTHPDSDHLVGLVEVLNRYQVSHVLLTGVSDDLPAYQELWKKIKTHNVKVLIAGNVKAIQVESGLVIDIFHPQESLEGKIFEDNNEQSLVFKLEYKNFFSVLFTGDASKALEDALISQNFDLQADILKIGHHGSDTSSGVEFLKKVSPNLAIILAGENRFGHPHGQVLQRLKDQSIKFLSTKSEGDIMILVDQGDFQVDFRP